MEFGKTDAWHERQAAMEFLGRYVLAGPAKSLLLDDAQRAVEPDIV
jgi:hypothetical protein